MNPAGKGQQLMDVRNSVLNLSVLKAGRLYFAEGSALDLRKAMSRGPRGPKVDFRCTFQ